MKETKFILATILIAALPLAVASVVRSYHQEFSRVPEKLMWIDGRNIKSSSLVYWPQTGMGTATILSRKFTIAFEGVSWSSTLVAGGYQVDGRYGGIGGPDSGPKHQDMGNGVTYNYNPRKREMMITYRDHQFIFCDYLDTLKAGGKEYSTAQGMVHLWVSKKGQIKQLKRV